MAASMVAKSSRVAVLERGRLAEGAPPVWSRLNFVVQHQEQTNWCWAATTASIAEYYDGGPLPGQLNWKWCKKCQGLAFSANLTGPCPAGGSHDHAGSGNYSLLQNVAAGAGQQSNWKWCNKCQALAFAGNPSLGSCPAGGTHNHTGSGNYVLKHNIAAGAGEQGNWKWCNKCQGLAFAGNPFLGSCPGGGTHNHAGSGNYSLVHIARRQCSYVNSMFAQTTCCQNGSTSQCNQAADTGAALKAAGHLAKQENGASPYSTLKAEIDAGRPLVVRIVWSGGGAHAVVLEGYQASGAETVAVEDPWYGPSSWDYQTFQTAYQDSGSWTVSRFTK